VIFPFADEQVRVTRKNLWVTLDEDLARPLKTAYLPAQKSLADTVYRELYEDEMDRSVVDMVNVLYVALTRPEERLYVLAKDILKKPKGFLLSPNCSAGSSLVKAHGQKTGTFTSTAKDGNNLKILKIRKKKIYRQSPPSVDRH